MNQKQAIRSLSYFAAERDRAHRSNMVWMPSPGTDDEITEARHVLAKSKKSARELLSKQALSLFESEAHGRFPTQ